MDRGVAPRPVNANCGLGSLRTSFLNHFTPDRTLRGVTGSWSDSLQGDQAFETNVDPC